MLKLMGRDGALRRIVESAAAAPSIHNTQPWHFEVTGDDVLTLQADPDRALWAGDPHARGLYLSCGAALFNIRTAIRAIGFNPRVWPLPHPSFSPLVLAVVQAEAGRPPTSAERDMYNAIWRRHTNRAPFTGERLADSVRAVLEQAADAEFASLRMLPDRDCATVLDLAEVAASELARDIDHQAELRDWIATGSDQDGIPAASLPPRPVRRPAPVRSADFEAAAPQAWRPEGDYEARPQLAVLTTTRDEPADWLRAGQALQRVLLTATMHGVSASMLYQIIELHDVCGDAGPSWPWPEIPQMVLRLGYGPEPAATPRRSVDDVITRQAGYQRN
jgi:nitroreductase